MAEVVWIPLAYDDLSEIYNFIARDRPKVAGQVVSRIVQATRRLEAFPLIGRVVPELERPDVREVFVQEIRIIYKVDADRVRILAIRHGARLLRDVPGL